MLVVSMYGTKAMRRTSLCEVSGQAFYHDMVGRHPVLLLFRSFYDLPMVSFLTPCDI